MGVPLHNGSAPTCVSSDRRPGLEAEDKKLSVDEVKKKSWFGSMKHAFASDSNMSKSFTPPDSPDDDTKALIVHDYKESSSEFSSVHNISYHMEITITCRVSGLRSILQPHFSF